MNQVANVRSTGIGNRNNLNLLCSFHFVCLEIELAPPALAPPSDCRTLVEVAIALHSILQ